MMSRPLKPVECRNSGQPLLQLRAQGRGRVGATGRTTSPPCHGSSILAAEGNCKFWPVYRHTFLLSVQHGVFPLRSSALRVLVEPGWTKETFHILSALYLQHTHALYDQLLFTPYDHQSNAHVVSPSSLEPSASAIVSEFDRVPLS